MASDGPAGVWHPQAARDKLKAQQSMFRPDAPVFVRQAFPTLAVNFG
eukprot:COSAG01_NODE_2106_length_8416_cov_47.839485_17_plen_47_part_00